MIKGVIYSFTNFRGFGDFDFVGFMNYKDFMEMNILNEAEKLLKQIQNSKNKSDEFEKLYQDYLNNKKKNVTREDDGCGDGNYRAGNSTPLSGLKSLMNY